MFIRVSVFLYGVVSYIVFLGTFGYTLGFVGNLVVPITLDGKVLMPIGQALLVDLVLLGGFAVQHSVMARPFFKSWLTRFLPESAERSTYVLFSSLALFGLFIFWQPLGGVVWDTETPMLRSAIYGAFALGWLLVLGSSFLINHFDLFGLRQVWRHLVQKPYTRLEFGTPGPYKLVRHPLYLGWLLAFWSTPTMTGTHLLFALSTTAYILTAIRFEERDLVNTLGDDYRRYRERVPMILPFGRRAPPVSGPHVASAPRTSTRHRQPREPSSLRGGARDL